jgi:hypothetical protein
MQQMCKHGVVRKCLFFGDVKEACLLQHLLRCDEDCKLGEDSSGHVSVESCLMRKLSSCSTAVANEALRMHHWPQAPPAEAIGRGFVAAGRSHGCRRGRFQIHALPVVNIKLPGPENSG